MKRNPAAPSPSALDRMIAAALRPPYPFLDPISRRVPRAAGKRRRGGLILVLGRLFGAPPGKVVAAAAAVEIIHLASLIHDDVVDGAHLRRARPALQRVHGSAAALLYGDLLFSRGISLVNRLGEPKLTELLLETVSAICGGEILETRERENFPWEEETYLEIITLKTASLFEYSCQAPAILAGFSPPRLKVLKKLGRDLGLAYQIADDCLDFSPAGRTGKTPLADLRNRVPNLPLLYASREPGLAGKMRRVSASGFSPAAGRRLGAAIREGGFVDAARRRAGEYAKKARRTAAAMVEWPLSGEITDLARYLGLEDQADNFEL